MNSFVSPELTETALKHDIFIAPASQPLSAIWFSERFGVCGVCTWQPAQSDWLVRALTIDGKQYSIDSLARGILGDQDYNPDRGMLTLLATMVDTQTAEVTETGWLSETTSRDRILNGQRRDELSIRLLSPEDHDWHRPFAVALMRWAHYARVKDETQRLALAVPHLDIFDAGGMVPFQASGLWEEYPFYFRYRHGHASLSVGGEDPVTAPRWTASATYGDPMSGFLTVNEFHYLFCYLGHRLEPAPQLYVFRQGDDGLSGMRRIYAFSEFEARQRMKTTSDNPAAEKRNIELVERPVDYPDVSPPRVANGNAFISLALEGEAGPEAEWHW